ncbi:MAG: peptidoglycan editing factor PgeF [Pseudomonadota bacterium]
MSAEGLLSHCLRPDWPAPAHVHALVTTRAGGISAEPFNSLNLGDHVGDDPAHVAGNRSALADALSLVAPAQSPQWLKQVHGVRVITPPTDPAERAEWIPEADAATTTHSGVPITVMTADCLPVFFTDRQGSRVAVAHAGWRGLCDGILEATVAEFAAPVAAPAEVMAWLGPAIGPASFEVGDEVRAAFMSIDAQAELAFVPVPNKPGHWLGDLYLLARQRLARVGVTQVSGGTHCTMTESASFYSYRRDGRTGRMASVIWMSPMTSPARPA